MGLRSTVNTFNFLGNAMASLITIDPEVCQGKPCIRGMRCPVDRILEWSVIGMTIEDFWGDYEVLQREDIFAALSFAARLTHIKRA
jgi:hypothetical protein